MGEDSLFAFSLFLALPLTFAMSFLICFFFFRLPKLENTQLHNASSASLSHLKSQFMIEKADPAEPALA